MSHTFNITHNITKNIVWNSNSHFKIDDISFFIMTDDALYSASTLDEKNFVLGKTRRQIETLVNLDFSKNVNFICDIGIYKGGSVAFYHKLFSPKKLLAIDLQEEVVASLEKYIHDNGLNNTIKTYYGVDQADISTINKILATEMLDDRFDLVVDDASHFLRQTRTSFNIFFPFLVKGGYYIIEDWGWAHWNFPFWQDNGGPWPHEQPLTNLVFEMTMLLASIPDLVESVYLLPAYAVVKKGSNQRDCTAGHFDISKAYLNRGKVASLLE